MTSTSFWTNAVVRGGKVLLRGVENGKRFKREVAYEPTLYRQADDGQKRNMQTIYGKPVVPITFPSIYAARDALKGGDLFGFDKFGYAYLAETYYEQIEHDPSLIRVAVIDIETMADKGMPTIEGAEAEVTALTMKIGDRIFVFGTRPYVPSDPRVIYRECSDERELLRQFLGVWSSEEYCPDIVTGWNIELFDIPYLVNRITKVLGESQAKRLSPWRILTEKTIYSRGADHTVRFPLGVSVLDYMRLYHKLAVMTRAVDTPDDMKLNTVATVEVGEKKLDYSQFEGLHDLYVRDYQTYVDYNIHDVILVDKIDDKRQLIDLVMAMAYNAKVNFEDMLGSVTAWECIIHHKLLEKGVVLPPRRKNTKRELVGAFVKDPPPKGFNWVVSFDLNSLYSHLIMQWNISPETRIGELSERLSIDQILAGELVRFKDELVGKDAIVSANMRLFDRRKKGFLPLILEEMYKARKVAKAEAIEAKRRYEETHDPAWKKAEAKWKNMDKVHKTNLNAAYGVLTNEWFLFYDHANAEAITTSGQLAIRWVEQRVNAFLNKTLRTTGKDFIIAMDTDSIYINMGPIVDKVAAGKTQEEVCDFLVKLCGPIKGEVAPMERVIDEAYQELADMVNAVDQKMVMKRETIASRGIWTGAKNYILNVLDEETVRFKEPEIKMKGVAAVKSSTPPACRDKLKEAVKVIMTKTQQDMYEFVQDFRREFDGLPFHEIAFPRSISDMRKWVDGAGVFRSGTPIQVRAAHTYNRYVTERNLVQYPLAYDDDRVKYAYLRMPNRLRENVFGTPGPIPPELEIERLIDRDENFERGFMQPLKKILDAVGWRVEDVGASLEQLL